MRATKKQPDDKPLDSYGNDLTRVIEMRIINRDVRKANARRRYERHYLSEWMRRHYG